ncbi:type II secretion system protein M [Dokdonella sp.]|uniref:type II secretion system protein M n=1 Tax=Dokdonella sp. TaxID=2291710 RepID=UPI0025C58D1D|nr:type II secretion system protein M [Dokdonella sp.]MBX3689545.1 type II secretion system protein M [Dokdonella sp.]
MIKTWWQGVSERDRRTLRVGAVVVAGMLFWALVWSPLAQRRAALEQDVATRRDELAAVERGTALLAQQHALGKRARGDRAGKSLLALADASARDAGLGEAIKQIEPAGSRHVKLSLDAANFDALIGWLEALSRGYGVEASELSADRADGIGLVNARVTLQDAP